MNSISEQNNANNANNVNIQVNGTEFKNKNATIFVSINNIHYTINSIEHNGSENVCYLHDDRLVIHTIDHTENLINHLLENKHYYCLKILLFFKFTSNTLNTSNISNTSNTSNTSGLKNILLPFYKNNIKKNILIPFYNEIVKKNNKIYLELKRLFDFEFFDSEFLLNNKTQTQSLIMKKKYFYSSLSKYFLRNKCP